MVVHLASVSEKGQCVRSIYGEPGFSEMGWITLALMCTYFIDCRFKIMAVWFNSSQST